MAVSVPLSNRLSRPPAGTYDPGLDAQLRAANRGYGDVQQDIDIAGSRASGDYATGRARAEQGFGRSLADILRQRVRTGEDVVNQIHGVRRQFASQGRQQGEGAARRGVTQGGTLAASLAKRTANQALTMAPIEQNYHRFLDDSSRGEQELYQDYGDPTTGLYARMDTDFARGAGDRAMQLGRAGRENTFYGQDIAEQRAYQAAQMGWSPPPQQALPGQAPRIVRSVRQPTVRVPRRR